MCDECSNMFRAADIEYGATIYSVPQPCPKCGSKHTMPIGPGHLLGKFNPLRPTYQRIWKEADNCSE